MNKDKILEGTQLGLPPMELAETKKMNDENFNSVKRYFYPTLHKIVQIVLIILFAMGFCYIVTWQLLTDNSQQADLVIQATSELANVTLDKAEIEIVVHLKNITSHYEVPHKRKRRYVKKTTNENVFSTDEQFKKARDIIMKHDRICNKQNQNEICKELTMQLKAIAAGGDDNLQDFHSTQDINPNHNHDNELNQKPLYYINQRPHVPFSKTCLLAHFLQRHYPFSQELLQEESSFQERNIQDMTVQHKFTLPGYEPQAQIEVQSPRQKQHPQDLNIFMKLFTPREDNLQSSHCPIGSLPCNSGGVCIDENKWCNNKVDCDDASDELQCNCKSRIHKSRLCDGYFDCPLGEDEIGCFGCDDKLFSCGDVDDSMRSTCFTKEQRCNNIVDCPNRRDEFTCNMLAPTIREEPIFAVSNTNGFLLRNFGGKWFAVCQNPQMWAHYACQQETGPIKSPPYIQEVAVHQQQDTNYLNLDSAGFVFMSDNCFNSSAIHVTCPNMLCGTRILSESQLVNENIAIENDIVGRNKREESSYVDVNARLKRAETRVVGGRPSQPAAWPWMVALYRDGTFHCGGVILTKMWVMSAAHCITEFWEHYYEVQVGMLRRFSFSLQEQNHVITHVVINRQYRQDDMQNDISLLRVKNAIQFGQWVRPICLPQPSTAGPDWFRGPAPGTICTGVGWGAMKERGPDPDQLREVQVPIWEKCKHTKDLKGDEICAAFEDGGKDTCQGDSGGPLLCRNPMNPQQWYMAGIVSHGDGCGRNREPGVYTRVSHYLKWIKSNLFSRSLPVIQPKNECPGFKCTSGITKCIPKHRICDKIIDCLNGEDEINCKYSDKGQVFTVDKLFGDISNARTNTMIKNFTNSITEDDGLASSTTQISEINTDQDTTVETTTTHVFEIATISTITSTKSDAENLSEDLEHASTFEINISHSSSESDESTSEARGDTEIFTQTLSAESFESMSSILANDTGVSFTELHISNPLFSTESNLQKETELTESITETSKVENFTENIELFSTHNNSINDKKQQETIKEKILAKVELTNKLEDMLISEMLPPKIRKKHKTPKEFECRRMLQIIPYTDRCDHKADCEDGTDELSCTCIDYLTTFDNSLICDGVFDCNDGQDETDCFTCPDNHFLCRHSKLCIPEKNWCDGVPQCPYKEDESDCYALSNGHEMVYDIEQKPELLTSGYLTKKIGNSWHVECEDLLYHEDQKKSANDVCRHLGFSSASLYGVKYISIKDENLKRNVRSSHDNRIDMVPVKFVYKKVENDTPTYLSIIDSIDIGLECKTIPKTCMALHVECDHILVTDFELLQDLSTGRSTNMNHVLPWMAKVFVDGHYKCTGVLLDLSWVLIPHSCLWDAVLTSHYITVSLGSHRTHKSNSGPYEQILAVDMKRDLYRSKVVLLHLDNPAKYTAMVKPMNIPLDIQYDEKTMCVAVGQNENNRTITVFVTENNIDCDIHNRCFKRINNDSVCPENMTSKQEWSGIISCHTKQGWYPAASFIDSRGECGVGELFVATDIGYLINELKDPPGKILPNTLKEDCIGVRCARGRCLGLHHVCNGITECEDGKDESESACHKKETICEKNPFFNGCECTSGELKCKNGQCILKDLFKNGMRDCEDGTDEPGESTCFDYLTRVMPSRLCDGVLHCQDRSDEDPDICKCYAKKFYKCGKTKDDVEFCVSPDVVCDGVQDCPNADDEKTCLAINSPDGANIGTGEIIVNSHGVWHRKCYQKKKHTKTELEKICRQLGFISGHAKQLDFPTGWSEMSHNSFILDSFNEIKINENTTIKLRNSHKPLASSVFDATIENCHPLYIECM